MRTTHYILHSFLMIGTLIIWSKSSLAQRTGVKPFKAIELNAGMTSLLGDLGGADEVGSNGISDFDLPAVRYSAGMGIVWRSMHALSYKSSIQYAQLHGSDQYTAEKYRNRRNITVTTHVASFSMMTEYKMGLGRSAKRGKGYFVGMQVGLGAMFFQPTARYKGDLYLLHDIGTEGQFLDPNKKEYSRFTVVIPAGVTWSYQLDRTRSYGMEILGHKSFTDYLDDVSTTYHHPGQMKEAGGDAAGYLSDPNTTGTQYQQGTQRGNPGKNDYYFTVSFFYRHAWMGSSRTKFRRR